jgi:RNA polymerase sigma-70 factor (ECF subfamily)
MVTEREFLNIYNAYYQKIVQYLSRIVGSGDAEDMAQEVFDKVSRGIEEFRGTSKLSTWIYRIATNTAIDRS